MIQSTLSRPSMGTSYNTVCLGRNFRSNMESANNTLSTQPDLPVIKHGLIVVPECKTKFLPAIRICDLVFHELCLPSSLPAACCCSLCRARNCIFFLFIYYGLTAELLLFFVKIMHDNLGQHYVSIGSVAVSLLL